MNMSLAVVGVDPSLSSTGVALADGGFATISTSAKGPKRLEAIRDRLLKIALPCDIVVIEGYSMASHQGAHQLGELGGVLRLALWQAGVPYVEVAPTRLKKWATGKGNAPKDQVLAKAARRWPGVSNNDEADAAWLRDMGWTHYCGVASKAHAEILAQVDWPALRLAEAGTPPSLVTVPPTAMPWDQPPAA
jgi:crossover junction endodeoxyribonuclease RuvC